MDLGLKLDRGMGASTHAERARCYSPSQRACAATLPSARVEEDVDLYEEERNGDVGKSEKSTKMTKLPLY